MAEREDGFNVKISDADRKPSGVSKYQNILDSVKDTENTEQVHSTPSAEKGSISHMSPRDRDDKKTEYILKLPQPRNTLSDDAEIATDDSQSSLQDGGEFEERPRSAESGDVPGEDGVVSAGWEDERVGRAVLFGVPIVSLHVPQGGERLCLAQISSLLLKDFSYNEIHNRRVALGITCLQCTPSQLEVLRRAGAMPVSSRRCGLITKREAERLVRSFIADVPPPRLPDNFTFRVRHTCGWGCEGLFVPARYNSSRAKCIKCTTCMTYFSPNKFIFHFHRSPTANYRHPDAANFNSWRRHLELVHDGNEDRLLHAWEDVKAMFNGGCRKRFSVTPSQSSSSFRSSSSQMTASSNLESFPSPTYRRIFSNYDASQPASMSQPSNSVADDANPLAHAATGTVNSTEGRMLKGVKHYWEGNGSTAANQGAKLGSHMSSFPAGAGGPTLPFPSQILGGPHQAFFNSGLGVVSYGEFLRSMSLPYSSNNYSSGSNYTSVAPSQNTSLLDWYPSPALPSLLPRNAPGILGVNTYPVPYFGYPQYPYGNNRNQTSFRQSSSGALSVLEAGDPENDNNRIGFGRSPFMADFSFGRREEQIGRHDGIIGGPSQSRSECDPTRTPLGFLDSDGAAEALKNTSVETRTNGVSGETSIENHSEKDKIDTRNISDERDLSDNHTNAISDANDTSANQKIVVLVEEDDSANQRTNAFDNKAISANENVSVSDKNVSGNSNSKQQRSADSSDKLDRSASFETDQNEKEKLGNEKGNELRINEDCSPSDKKDKRMDEKKKQREEELQVSTTGRGDGALITESKREVPTSKIREMKESVVPRDTESLLKMLEDEQDINFIEQLPVRKLRRLLKMVRVKSESMDREHRKITEMQRLQRLRAAELREEFSRQFLAIKENIWTEIEQERKLKTALQERLTEVKHLVPKIPSLSLFPNLD